jgi:hypothetical protein
MSPSHEGLQAVPKTNFQKPQSMRDTIIFVHLPTWLQNSSITNCQDLSELRKKITFFIFCKANQLLFTTKEEVLLHLFLISKYLTFNIFNIYDLALVQNMALMENKIFNIFILVQNWVNPLTH